MSGEPLMIEPDAISVEHEDTSLFWKPNRALARM